MSILPVANNVRNSAQPVSNVYQDNSNLKVASARVLNKEAYRFGFQSTTLGSSANTLTIPKNLMGSHVLIQFQFNLLVADLPVGYYLPRGWGLHALRRLTLVYGGSEQLEIDGRDNAIRCINECEDDRKKTALLELAGTEVFNNAGTITGLDPGQDGTVGGIVTAVIPVYLPHSSVNADKQIPFDFGVLNMNATIRADLRTADELWNKTRVGTEAEPAVKSNAMKQFSKAEWIVGQQVMVDSSASKRDLVGPSGQFQLNYFWYYPSHFEAQFALPAVRGEDRKTVSATVNTTLNAFRNGSLQSMVFYVERLDGFSDRLSPNLNGLRNQMQYLEMTDIKLEYGGQIVYTADNSKVAQALDYMINTTDSTYDYPLVGNNGLNTANIIANNRSNYYRVQLSQFSEVFRSYLQNGSNMSSDTMQLSFKVIDNRGVIDDDASVTQIRYRINTQYLYQSSLSVAKGVGAFTFVNPSPSPLPQQLSIAP